MCGDIYKVVHIIHRLVVFVMEDGRSQVRRVPALCTMSFTSPSTQEPPSTTSPSHPHGTVTQLARPLPPALQSALSILKAHYYSGCDEPMVAQFWRRSPNQSEAPSPDSPSCARLPHAVLDGLPVAYTGVSVCVCPRNAAAPEPLLLSAPHSPPLPGAACRSLPSFSARVLREWKLRGTECHGRGTGRRL